MQAILNILNTMMAAVWVLFPDEKVNINITAIFDKVQTMTPQTDFQQRAQNNLNDQLLMLISVTSYSLL